MIPGNDGPRLDRICPGDDVLASARMRESYFDNMGAGEEALKEAKPSRQSPFYPFTAKTMVSTSWWDPKRQRYFRAHFPLEAAEAFNELQHRPTQQEMDRLLDELSRLRVSEDLVPMLTRLGDELQEIAQGFASMVDELGLMDPHAEAFPTEAQRNQLGALRDRLYEVTREPDE